MVDGDERSAGHQPWPRKNSFGTGSEQGRTFAERLLTVVTSLRAQGRDVLEYLEGAIRAAAVGGAVPALAAVAPG